MLGSRDGSVASSIHMVSWLFSFVFLVLFEAFKVVARSIINRRARCHRNLDLADASRTMKVHLQSQLFFGLLPVFMCESPCGGAGLARRARQMIINKRLAGECRISYKNSLLPMEKSRARSREVSDSF
jgi:hypothetical protein